MINNVIYITVSLALFYNGANARGPHHPRGETVSKHHVHYRPTREAEEKLTQDTELLHDTEHIKEHLDYISDPDLSSLSDEEIEFYYFQVHDTDKNSKLDGLEILQAILHTKHNHKEEQEQEQDKTDIDEEIDLNYYVELIDKVLLEDDKNNDGYLSYAEYVEGRKKELKEIEAENEEVPAVKML